MTSYEFQRYLDSLVDATSTEHLLTKYVFVLYRGYDQVAADLTGILHARNRTIFSKRQQETQQRYAEFRRHADNFPLGQIFHEIIGLQRALTEMKEAFGEEHERFIDTFSSQLDDLYTALERCVKTPDDEAFTALMMEAHHLYPMMNTARDVFLMVRRGLIRKNEVAFDTDEVQLALVFAYDQTYEGVVSKMTALKRAYAEVADLVHVSVDDSPLRLVQVETGSLWLTVQGHARVMRVLTALVERFTTFLQHRFSIRGNGSPVSERVMSTQSLINLADELELAGAVDVLDDEPRLKQSALTLRHDITQLLAGEPSVRINGTLYAVSDEVADYYIEQTVNALPARIQPLSLSQHGS